MGVLVAVGMTVPACGARESGSGQEAASITPGSTRPGSSATAAVRVTATTAAAPATTVAAPHRDVSTKPGDVTFAAIDGTAITLTPPPGIPLMSSGSPSFLRLTAELVGDGRTDGQNVRVLAQRGNAALTVDGYGPVSVPPASGADAAYISTRNQSGVLLYGPWRVDLDVPGDEQISARAMSLFAATVDAEGNLRYRGDLPIATGPNGPGVGTVAPLGATSRYVSVEPRPCDLGADAERTAGGLLCSRHTLGDTPGTEVEV